MVARIAALACLASAAFAAGPSRIVSTAPSITEILYALGLGDRVAAVTTFCHYPPEAARKPVIGNYLNPSVERILALKPDLVIAEKSMLRQTVKLPSLKLNVLEVDDATVPGIYDTIRRIGQAAGVPDRATALCASIRGELERIRTAGARAPRPRVLFVVGRTPGGLQNLIAAGGSSYLNEVMAIAGGENVLRGAPSEYVKISLEEVLARNPGVIVDMGDMAQTVGVTEAQKRAVVALWGRYPALAAVRERRVFAVASDIFVVPGPRVVEAAREFLRMFHGPG